MELIVYEWSFMWTAVASGKTCSSVSESLFALASVFCTSTDFVDILPFDDCSLKGQKCHDTSKSVSVKEPKPGRTVVLLKILS